MEDRELTNVDEPTGCSGTTWAEAYLTLRRVEEEVRDACLRFGILGDPFANDVPALGSLHQEQEVLDICLSLPSDVRRAAQSLARRMVRASVLTHIDPVLLEEEADPESKPRPDADFPSLHVQIQR